MPVYQIAVCDDNASFAQSMAAQCEKIMERLNMPASIRLFYSFEEVLRDYAKGGQTDLLFLDIMLGQKNGIDLAQRLKERGFSSPVVLMTTDRGYLLDGYAVQPLYFLIKPIDPEQLEGHQAEPAPPGGDEDDYLKVRPALRAGTR